MPQDGPKIVPRALLAALGLSWTALGPLLAALGRSWLAPGASWADLGASWGDLGPSWGDLGAILGDLGAILGAPEGLNSFGGRRWSRDAWPPPRDFLRKFLPSRDLKSLLIDRDIAGGLQHAVQGAAD